MTTKISTLAIDLARTVASRSVPSGQRGRRFHKTEGCRGRGLWRFLPSSQLASLRWRLGPRRTIGAGWRNGTATRLGLFRWPSEAVRKATEE